MRPAKKKIRLQIKKNACWGHFISEDSGEETCHQCVELCPEVFEKPFPTRCAQVRRGADVKHYLKRVLKAIEECPSGAIRFMR